MEKTLMLAFASKKLTSTAVVVITTLSLFWFINSTAEVSNLKQELLPEVVIKNGADLATDGDEASKKQIPVLMFFSMKHCPFCIEVEEDYLKPMLRNSEYDSKIIIRKIRIDGTDSVRDFAGKEHDADDFSDLYNVSMVPTLVLVDSKGRKISPSIIGIANAHYYSHELDKAINSSTKKIRTFAKR